MQSIYRISKTNIEFHEHTYMFGEHMYAMHQCVSVWTKDSCLYKAKLSSHVLLLEEILFD